MVFSSSEFETIRIATDFAHTLAGGDVVLLEGDLGAGKSVFCRAVIRTLSENQELEVPSPTFTLLQTYDTPKGEVFHFDLYRLKSPEELFDLGWEDALSGGIVFVEWPERLGPYCPKNAKTVSIGLRDDEKREITIK